MKKKRNKDLWKKVWFFIWEDDSAWSWVVNIILAFVLIKFIVYPGLGLALSTGYPIVAVVSSSMEHGSNFDSWWEKGGSWYEKEGIDKESFADFHLKNGFNKGDIMVLRGKNPEDIKIGEVIVFISHKSRPKTDPIIHRVVKKWREDGKFYFQTKGDNYMTNKNPINSCDLQSCVDETKIDEEQLIGNAVLKIPLLGYIKIFFVDILRVAGLLK